MKRRIPVLLFFTIFTAVHAAAQTLWSYSINGSGTEYGWFDEISGLYIQEQMAGVDIRGSSLSESSGFYYGTYLSFARPLYTSVWNPDDDSSGYYSTGYDFYTSVGLPFGYRWQLPLSPSAFYLGAGPAAQALFDFDSHMWASGGMMLEIGMEAMESGRTTFSLGFRMLIGWASAATDWYTWEQGPTVTSTALYMGVGWVGVRKP